MGASQVRIPPAQPFSTAQSLLWRMGRAIGLALALSTTAAVQAQEQSFDVPAQSASSGVREFARQAGIQIIMAGEAAAGRNTNHIRGALDTRQALESLLVGTGLVVRSFDGKVALLAVKGDAAGGEPRTLDRMVVTGSRIARPELLSSMPVSVTRMDEVFNLGITSAYDALMLDPSMGIGQNLSSASNGWDAGIAAANLRNLGTNRSLTLIDGQRRVSSSARSSAVDVGMVPVGMIDRVEVATGGAAAIYGADAVTGALNIITRRDIDETTVSVTTGLSSRGDAGEHQFSMSTGGKFSEQRGSFTFGGSWSKIEPLVYADRYDWQDYPYYIANPGNTGIGDGIPDRVRIEHFRQIYFDYRPTYYLNGKEWVIDNGVPREAVYDTLYSGDEFSLGDGGDGRNLLDDESFRGGLDSLALMGRADFDFTGGLAYGGYFSYARQDYRAGGDLYRDDSRQAFFSGAGGSVAYLDNPYLPAALRQVMQQNGLTRLNISRSYGNFPAREYVHERETFTLGQTLGGRAGQYLKWQAFWQYGRARDDATERNIAYKSHWIAARDVIADPLNGAPVCRDQTARAAGCLPLDIFGQQAPSQALLDYVMADRHEQRINSQQVFGANIGGGLFSLPAGEVSAVIGAEHRRETLRTKDDPLALSGELQYDMGPDVHPELDVSFEVSEVYGEIAIPLLRDHRFARRFELDAAYRYSHYSTVGGTDAWKAGITWSPFDGVSLRGVRSRSVRTPNFGERYEPRVTIQRGSIDDPCEAGAYYASQTRERNCAAMGVATPLPDIKVGPLTTTEGNPDLRPETSDILTLGFVVQPGLLPGLALTADYWDIDIRDAITQFGDFTVLSLCVDLPTIDNPYCALSMREAPLGNPVSITSPQVNAPRLHARGIDFSVGYHRPLGNGQLDISLKGTRLLEHVTETMPGVEAGNVVVDGSWQAPHWRAILRADYQIGRFNVLSQARFRGSSTYDLNVDSEESYSDNSVPSTTYNDVALQYRFAERSSIGFGIRNLFDVQRPYFPGIYENHTVYDLVGRYFYATLNLRF